MMGIKGVLLQWFINVLIKELQLEQLKMRVFQTVVAERFIRILKNKIYKYMTLISKNAYIDKLDDIVNKYNNTYHSRTKMKPVDVKSNT